MPQPETPSRVPRFILLASICVVVAALYFASDVLVPLALAILFTFLLAPFVVRLERWGLPRVPSVITVFLLALGVVGLIGYAVVSQAQQLGSDLPTYSKNISAKLNKVLPARGGAIDRAMNTGEEILQNVTSPSSAPSSEPATQPAGQKTSGTETDAPKTPGSKANPFWVVVSGDASSPLHTLQVTLTSVLGPLGTAGIVVVVTLFMLLAREDLRDRLIRLVGHDQITLTTQAIDDAAQRISRYLLMQSMVNGTYGVAITIGLWLIGVPNPVLFGLLCFTLRFLPYIGPWIGASFPIIVSLGRFPGSREALETIGLFVVVELVTNNVLEPWLYGSSTGISTVAVLVAAVFWTWLWGPIGLLLSTPLTVVLVVIGKYVPQLRFLDIMLGDEPVLAPSDRVYQRLIALDAEVATELARQFREESSLEEVYDGILLPALAHAEQDQRRGQLQDGRLQFIRQALRDIVDELGETERKNPSERKSLPKDCTINILCLPAHNEADDIANLMLMQLLQLRNYSVTSRSADSLASEMLDAIDAEAVDAIVVSAMPPSSVAHARYLCKRVRNRFGELPMLVGLWLFPSELAKTKDRIGCDGTVQIVSTLKGALHDLEQMVQSALVK